MFILGLIKCKILVLSKVPRHEDALVEWKYRSTHSKPR